MTNGSDSYSKDIAIISQISAVPTILDVICRATGMGFAAVARVTEERWIACTVLDNINFGLKAGGELKVESTICHEIRESRLPVIIDHVAQDAKYCEHHTPRQYGFQSYISMPIFLSGGKFFGTLCSIDPKPAKLNTPEVIGMFKLFAELIAFHIDAAEDLARTKSKLLAERQVSELREVFIGVLGHDLRTPLGAVSMLAQSLKETNLDSEQTDAVQNMEGCIDRMAGLIDDTLDFTRGRLGGGITLDTFSSASVESVVNQVIEEVRIAWPKRVIETSFELAENIQYDRNRFAQLFANLLSNAMTYGKPDRPVTVSVKSRDGKFELSVANAADPIPANVLQHLFEPFTRGVTNNRKGLGLGLYIASQIAKSHGGTLTASSTPAETRFTFKMSSSGREI